MGIGLHELRCIGQPGFFKLLTSLWSYVHFLFLLSFLCPLLSTPPTHQICCDTQTLSGNTPAVLLCTPLRYTWTGCMWPEGWREWQSGGRLSRQPCEGWAASSSVSSSPSPTLLCIHHLLHSPRNRRTLPHPIIAVVDSIYYFSCWWKDDIDFFSFRAKRKKDIIYLGFRGIIQRV